LIASTTVSLTCIACIIDAQVISIVTDPTVCIVSAGPAVVWTVNTFITTQVICSKTDRTRRIIRAGVTATKTGSAHICAIQEITCDTSRTLISVDAGLASICALNTSVGF
jgi:hypothetical protein